MAALAVSTATIFSFNVLQTSKIKRTVTPADKAIRAWAVSPTDTLQAAIKNRAFELKDMKAGTCSVVIEAEAPYVNTGKKMS